ncbi:class I SAM-dependent methyltransferase [Cellulophaga sp. 20_2_10]|uniref:THUMP-like domain-containing protein n=1 Tax=Cellulophaga sp. 20_2_10 TaxID=2942476 RepID=UPI00201A75C9|nr:class I SAM-dependent methyltransferase [Cellulophaga sp. 20_2_10]MCL5244828.1 class I SAM-dependent methyltransferase [Cellulophaga sp. 20_2_10]
MNTTILHTSVQDFITENLSTDIMSILLKKEVLNNVSNKEIAAQIEAKNKCKDKLPTWYNTPYIYYPNKLNIEQTSSEKTAAYKASIVNNKTLIDLTGGLGVDCFFFAKKLATVYHCEISETVSKIATHNFKTLGANNINTYAENGLDFLQKTPLFFDWIYIDPSRRNDAKGKVFFLEDCLPNVPEHLSLIFSKTDHILIKTSPLLDFSIGIKSLQSVKEIHVVALHNDVKELLWVLEKGYTGDIYIKTINLTKTEDAIFSFNYTEEKEAACTYSTPQQYVYEPNSAILKAGAFKSVAAHYNISKLHEHTHLYTSNEIIDFAGRSFKVEKQIAFNKKEIQRLQLTKANITTRNFPESVANIRKKFKIKDGGTNYLFFTTDCNNNKIVLLCRKV